VVVRWWRGGEAAKGARIRGSFGNSKRERGIVTNSGFGASINGSLAVIMMEFGVAKIEGG